MQYMTGSAWRAIWEVEVHLQLAAVHHVDHVRDGERRLCNVGRQHDLARAGWRHRKRASLVLWGHAGVQWQHPPAAIPAHAHSEWFGDLACAWRQCWCSDAQLDLLVDCANAALFYGVPAADAACQAATRPLLHGSAHARMQQHAASAVASPEAARPAPEGLGSL